MLSPIVVKEVQNDHRRKTFTKQLIAKCTSNSL